MLSNLEEILHDLKLGKPIILVDDENRENEGDIIFPAQFASYDNVKLLVNEARGLICAPMSMDIARKLNLPFMVANNTDPHNTAFAISVDAIDEVSTGISVADRQKTLLLLGDPHSVAEDFSRPGHIFPLISKQGGVLERQGHTEGSIDLLKLAGLYPVAVICEILNLDGTMARLNQDIIPLAKKLGLKIFSIAQLKAFREKSELFYIQGAKAKLPTVYGNFDIHIFINPFDQKEHIALSMGNVQGKKEVLTRVHSSCITGDIFHSLKCDCGDQLSAAMEAIAKNQEGLILYLNQEGRGIGLNNKIHAYALQEQGLDTVESNEALGFAPDLRDYIPAVQMLKSLNIIDIQIITNNPEKIEGLEEAGIIVSGRVPSTVPVYEQREGYLQTKKDKMRHML